LKPEHQRWCKAFRRSPCFCPPIKNKVCATTKATAIATVAKPLSEWPRTRDFKSAFANNPIDVFVTDDFWNPGLSESAIRFSISYRVYRNATKLKRKIVNFAISRPKPDKYPRFAFQPNIHVKRSFGSKAIPATVHAGHATCIKGFHIVELNGNRLRWPSIPDCRIINHYRLRVGHTKSFKRL